MSSTPGSRTRREPAAQGPAGVFSAVLATVVGAAAAKLDRKVVAWTDKVGGAADAGLDGLGERGVAEKAAAEGVKASLHGKSPAWAAIGGAWQSGPPTVRAAIVTAGVSAVLLLLLSPVLALVFLVSLLIIAAVRRGTAATES